MKYSTGNHRRSKGQTKAYTAHEKGIATQLAPETQFSILQIQLQNAVAAKSPYIGVFQHKIDELLTQHPKLQAA